MAATTSGTVGTTVLDVTALIEHAFRRCGKMPSTVSGEQQLMAKSNLFLLLTTLVNMGLSLWCIQKYVVQLVPGQAVYGLPPGAADVLGANFRTYVPGPLSGSVISGTAYSGMSFSSAVSPDSVTITFTASGTPALVVESSPDGNTWTQVAAFAAQQSVLPSGTALVQDIDNSVAQPYWRVRDTSGTMLAGAVTVWNDGASEIPMTAFNKDDYRTLPNKSFQSNTSLQYWYDKQINPQMWLWPVPSVANQMSVQYHRQIQDVGTLTNLVEAPQRWYQYIAFGLAELICAELPPGELPAGRLEYLQGKAAEHLQIASDGESDGAPIKLAPNLRGYTRG